MELLAPLAVILLSFVGLIVCHALKAACQEASALGNSLIVESQQAREQFDSLVQQLSAKPDPRGVSVDNLPPEWQEAILEHVPMDDENFTRLMERLHRRKLKGR